MIQERGYIIRTDGPYAWVQTERKSTCGQCAVNKGCGSNVFSSVLGNKLVEFRAINSINATAGDTVILGLQESALLKSALLMYLFPLLTMLFFAVVADFVLPLLGVHALQVWIGMSALFGFILAYLFVRQFTRRHQKDEAYQPVILRRANLSEQFSIYQKQEV